MGRFDAAIPRLGEHDELVQRAVDVDLGDAVALGVEIDEAEEGLEVAVGACVPGLGGGEQGGPVAEGAEQVAGRRGWERRSGLGAGQQPVGADDTGDLQGAAGRRAEGEPVGRDHDVEHEPQVAHQLRVGAERAERLVEVDEGLPVGGHLVEWFAGRHVVGHGIHAGHPLSPHPVGLGGRAGQGEQPIGAERSGRVGHREDREGSRRVAALELTAPLGLTVIPMHGETADELAHEASVAVALLAALPPCAVGQGEGDAGLAVDALDHAEGVALRPREHGVPAVVVVGVRPHEGALGEHFGPQVGPQAARVDLDHDRSGGSGDLER